MRCCDDATFDTYAVYHRSSDYLTRPPFVVCDWCGHFVNLEGKCGGPCGNWRRVETLKAAHVLEAGPYSERATKHPEMLIF